MFFAVTILKRRFCHSIAAAGLAFVTGFAGPVLSQATVKGSFGDWQLRCETNPAPTAPAQANAPAPEGEQCYLYQNIADDSSDRLNLIISILKLPNPKVPGEKRTILRVLAPLGVLLPRGLGLRLDDKDIGSTGFVRCWSNACIAEVDMDGGLVDQFKTAKQATFFFSISEEEARGLPVSLDKLGDGLAELK
jgi:invasion protein IalB